MTTSITYNRDCLEAMREMDDNAFELAIVDPPYGIGDKWLRPGENCHSSDAMRATTWGDKQWDLEAPPSEYFNELRRVTCNQIIWGGNHFHLPPTRGVIIWNKPEMNLYSMADGELAWSSFDWPLKIVTISRATRGVTIHPTQKPVALYKWLLTNYAKPGDRILDTHLGSGSSRIAAYDLGFDFVGYELDTDYYNAQEERFQRHIAQPKLFVPEPQAMTQAALI